MTRLLLAFVGLIWGMAAAAAHPHVYVNARAELVFDQQGQIDAVRHVWTFDQSYSAFATMGLDANKDGKLSREELAELAKVNVESLGDFQYFSFGKASGRKLEFEAPRDYWLEHHNDALTLFFTLPLKGRAPAKAFALEVYDPTYFVAFAFDDVDNAVVLSAAPAGCSVSVRRPPKTDLGAIARLGESFFEQLSAASDFGQQFANRAIVACP
jgi:ABC-type uncharacterized transport system substrate-binding protein